MLQRMMLTASLLWVPLAARANCARDVQDLTPQVAHIKDGHVRERAQDYLQRARRELNENDEFECQTAVGAINKLMQPPVAPQPAKP